MIRVIVVIFFLLISDLAYGQSYIKALIGSSDTEVRSYFQSLIDQSSASAYLKIEQAADDGGNLILKLSLPTLEETQFNCLAVYVKFVRVHGVEMCCRESILGSIVHAQENLNFVKDNYDSVSPGIWRQKHYNENELGVEVSYKREDESYVLTYLLKKTK
jgi:hypothetical protein